MPSCPTCGKLLQDDEEGLSTMRLLIALAAILVLAAAGLAHAADSGDAPPQMSGWIEKSIAKVEAEATSDTAMFPEIPGAVAREWRSFDSAGSAVGVLGDLVWVAVAAVVALFAEYGVARALSRRAWRRCAMREDGARLIDVLALLVCDIAGFAVFIVVFDVVRQHFLPAVGVTAGLGLFAANVLTRWRVVAVIVRVIFRPHLPAARLIDLANDTSRHLARFLSGTVLAVITLVGFARYGLMDEDSGASHVIGLVVAVMICALYSLIIVHARPAGEALIRGRRTSGMVAGVRAAIARAWVPIGLTLVAGLFLTFVAGLSLGLLGYYRAVSSTLGILFVLIVLDRLTEWDWHDDDETAGIQTLAARMTARVLRAVAVMAAVFLLAEVWTDAVEMSAAGQQMVMRSITTAVGTLFIAYLLWELIRLAIDRHMHSSSPGLPTDDDDAAEPASRLQTILPLLRAAFAVAIAVLAVLIALSQLGVNTAPLIAGAGVFGLAVSFGSQSLVRDIISGLFYMWDDAFRVGEYVDTGRLKGTVEKLGVRSVRLRHQNGPLHTIPYGQLGAVTNLSRDFATVKFNLRFDPRTDIELVRRTTKQIGLAMQDENEEMATEVMAPLKLQGIAEVVDSALVLRFKFTARPVKPSWVQREYLKRMYAVFAEKGITFASGAMVLQTLPTPDLTPPEPSKPAETGAAPVAAAIVGGVVAAEIAEQAAAAGDG
jgi:moderate conductance mechanosensitive channel